MIIVGGEALVDLVPGQPPAEGGLPPLHPRLGGGPYNTAIALGRLGAPAGMFTRLSTDRFGRELLARLHAAGVDSTMVQIGPEPTTLAVVDLDEHGAARYGFHTTGTAAPLVADPGDPPEGTTALCLGTLGMVLEPGASVYERMLFRYARQGGFVALDPNIRADLIGDPDGYRHRFLEWLSAVSLLKLSVEDAAWLAGLDPDEADVRLLSGPLRDWLRRGPAAVVLTRGAEGISVLTRQEELLGVPPAAVSVVDTIGAGDTIQAALLAWLWREDLLAWESVAGLSQRRWREALSHAAAAAGVTVSRSGAEPPYAAELAGGE
ncbi:carbohydrate kinase family protein [Actinopolyspora mortivallis]|uniref:Carbohydrate kinase n=1 Tax=Actinopolyspora mortivallis TaxID=33906 RepID=A0A2T0GX74_ACTMO|nr:carbohydrate kinase [Actinopolyspora mortivallis]PRW63711.1 carbohydrate kinase [Actinopolyspora mortivallis]